MTRRSRPCSPVTVALARALAVALAMVLAGCLPDDTRSPPGRLDVEVGADAALATGFVSADGWSIAYQRFLVVIGHIELESACEAYNENDYDRILDLTRGTQHLAVIYALGRCALGFRVTSPNESSLLGAGVGEGDKTFLRTPGTDAHAESAGVSVHVEGRAERLGAVKRFAWSFRRYLSYENCTFNDGELRGAGALFEEDVVRSVEIQIRGATLFQDSPDEAAAELRFEPFRAADDEHGDADGAVTLDELQNTPLANGGATTLGDRVYLELLPSLARFGGTGRCAVEASTKPPEDGF